MFCSGGERRLVTGFDRIRLEVQDLGSHDSPIALRQDQAVDETLLNLVRDSADEGNFVFDAHDRVGLRRKGLPAKDAPDGLRPQPTTKVRNQPAHLVVRHSRRLLLCDRPE